VTFRVRVSDPPRFETRRVTVQTPWDWKTWFGFWRFDVEDAPPPSPKFQDQVRVQLGGVVDRSVNWKSVIFFLPLDGLNMKSAIGGVQ
jgi:hypothetical protein